MNSDDREVLRVIMAIVGFLLLCGLACAYGCPKYGVWEQGLKGEAELNRASQNRKIAVNEAEAKREAAVALAQAEIERAKGVAEANRIIGEGLKGHEEYLRYLWIMSLENGSAPTIIYVPTEGNLPIMEAGRTVGAPPLHVEPAK